MNAYKEILIVDDEPQYRALMNKELRETGYHTVLAQNGAEALVALWERQHISLVLLDLRLPVVNGLDIFKIIRQYFSDKRIIIISALQSEDQRFLVYDADDYYDKSQNISSLIEKIDNLMNSSMKCALKENDKRSFRRTPVIILASCEKNKDDVFPVWSRFISYTKDLSVDGGRFIISEDIRVGQHLTMALELPDNSFPLLIDCEAVWVKKLEGFISNAKKAVEVGVRFDKLDSFRDEKKLKDYLNCV